MTCDTTHWTRLRQLASQGDEEAALALEPEARRRADVEALIVALCGARPEAARWDALCDVLDAILADDPRLEPHVALACAQLERWPDTLRTFPARWSSRLARGQRDVRWRICRRLTLEPLRPFPMRVARGSERGEMRQPVTWAADLLTALDPALHLTALELLDNRLDDDAVVRSAQAPALVALQHLMLRGNTLARPALAALADAPFAPQLESLAVCDDAGCDDDALAALLSPGSLGALRSLELTGCRLTERAAALLAAWPGLRHLESLALGRSRLGPRAIAALCAADAPCALRRLELRDAHLSAAPLRALLTAPALASLETLVLDGATGLDATSLAAATADLDGLPLRRLSLRATDLDDDAIAALVRSPWVRQLEHVELAGNPRLSHQHLDVALQRGCVALHGALQRLEHRAPQLALGPRPLR